MERENKNQKKVDTDEVKETGRRRGWTAVRAPPSPLRSHLSCPSLHPKLVLVPGAPASPGDLGAQCFG